jgi:hypothetical protein
VAISQLHQLLDYRAGATPVMKPRYSGMIQTVWTSFESFQKEMDTYQSSPATDNSSKVKSSAECFITLFDEMKKISK